MREQVEQKSVLKFLNNSCDSKNTQGVLSTAVVLLKCTQNVIQYKEVCIRNLKPLDISTRIQNFLLKINMHIAFFELKHAEKNAR